MGVLDKISRRSKGMPANATFRITQTGTEKLMEFSGDPKSRILAALDSGGTCDINEIAANSGLSRGQAERLVPQMVRGGYIQYVTSVSAED